MNNKDMKQPANLTDDAAKLLNSAPQKLDISARSYMRTIKVVHTITDLAHETFIQARYISEALQYRSHNYTADT